MYGAMPFVGIIVVVPLFTPGQEVSVDVNVEVIPVPDPIKKVLMPVQLLASLMVTEWFPDVRGPTTYGIVPG